MRGSKGITIFSSKALNPRMRYVFDISDTGGKNVKLTWNLEDENLKNYLDFLISEGQVEQYESTNRNDLKNSLKLFIGTNVWFVIKEEFSERLHELKQLSGSMIKEFSEKCESLQQVSGMEQLIYQSVMYAVGTRCGFNLSVQEQDFSQIVNIKDEEIVYRLDIQMPEEQKRDLLHLGKYGIMAMNDEISLEDDEINRELEELNTFGKNEEAGQYVQASFFGAQENKVQRKYDARI